MSVDTYLKRKNLKPYAVLEHQDVKILVAPSLVQWAQAVELNVKQFLVWKSFDVEAIARHEHGANCRH